MLAKNFNDVNILGVPIRIKRYGTSLNFKSKILNLKS